jgi:hypothetical protein
MAKRPESETGAQFTHCAPVYIDLRHTIVTSKTLASAAQARSPEHSNRSELLFMRIARTA